MSSVIANKIMFSPHPFSGSELIVLQALAWNSDYGGNVSGVSLRALALLSRMTEKRIRGVLRKLANEGAVTIKPGSGRGHYSVYALNLRIFNKTKSAIAMKGGVVRIFLDAATERRGEAYLAANKEALARDPSFPVESHFLLNLEPTPTTWSDGRPISRNTLQRRAARQRVAALHKLAAKEVDRVHSLLDDW
jgi:hypothetical protein